MQRVANTTHFLLLIEPNRKRKFGLQNKKFASTSSGVLQPGPGEIWRGPFRKRNRNSVCKTSLLCRHCGSHQYQDDGLRCTKLARLTLTCEVITYRLVEIRQNLEKSLQDTYQNGTCGETSLKGLERKPKQRQWNRWTSLVTLKTDADVDFLTLFQPGFFGAPKTKGRGHPKISFFDTTLVSMETIVSFLRWFIDFRFLTWNPRSKMKNLVPLAEHSDSPDTLLYVRFAIQNLESYE